jgi:type I restriction enzyme S subunit
LVHRHAPRAEHEQRAIAAHVKTVWGAIDRSQARIYDGFARLQDYRTALISTAVTGQIDVRDEV